ncbi:hypothetical protein Tco_0640581 [Tanacetum coccineum]
MRDGRRDNHTSQIYMKDDTPMCNPMEANYVQRYHGGYHDQNSKLSYSYQDRKPNHHYPKFQPRNRMSHPLQYFKIPETSTKEMMRKLIVGIKRLLDDLGVTADKLMLLVYKLLLSVFRVNDANMDQDSVHMVAASKVPMLKPGEYELWRMRMEQYIQMIDYSLWEVIENGNAPPITKVIECVETTIAPATAEEKA